MWCNRGCLGAERDSDAWLCHVSIAGGPRRRGCAAAGVSVFLDGPLIRPDRADLVDGHETALEALAGDTQVDPPDADALVAAEVAGALDVGLEAALPLEQGARVVVREVLDVA